MTPNLVFYTGSELLEGPVFDVENNFLFFVSILDGLVYCYNPETREILSLKLDSPVGCVFLMGSKIILAASKNGLFKLNFNTLQKEFVFQIGIQDMVRYNDGIQDANGRCIIGTMGYPQVKQGIGKVFSYYKGQYTLLIENTTISNGLAFSKDNKILYFVDTPTRKVAKYFYDIGKGTVKFDSYVIEFKHKAVPDGMCIDNQGMLWIAEWGGGCISRWNPLNGEKLQELQLPCKNVTSCCLDKHNNLYITTAQSEIGDDLYGGGIFYVELNKNLKP